MATVTQDVKYGVRMLAKNPGFALVAILTLALGIGANTAIFSLTDQVLLRALPVRNPEQLVIVSAPGYKTGHVSSDSNDAVSFSYPEYKDLRDRGPAFAGLLARFSLALNVAANGQTELADGELVSGNYFEVLGVRPELGRVFSSSDETAPGANPVAVLSYGYWTRRFGKDPGILNQPLMVNGSSLTVVGIAQPGFSGVQIGRSTDMFIPMSMKALMTPGWDGLNARNDAWLNMIGRLSPGFTVKIAEAAIAPAFRSIEESELPILKLSPGSKHAKEYLERRIVLSTGVHGRPVFQADARTPLLVLLTMVGLVLLIACANLASLLVARGEARQREMAVRLALGAGRWRLVRQLLTESFLVALAGGAAGVVFAAWTLGALVGSLQQGLGVIGGMGLETHLDPRVLLFALGISIATGLLFGLGPAFRATRTSLQTTLKDQGASVSHGKSNVQVRKWLMVSQVALTAMLLASAGYFAKSLVNLERQDLGVKIDHVLQFRISPSLNRYTTQQAATLFDRIRQGVAALPGVRGVAVASIPVFDGDDWGSNITVEGYAVQPDEETHVLRNAVGPSYFSAMGIPLVAGREFRERDTSTGPKVVIINEKMARKYFAGRDPVGLHIAWGAGVQPDIEIVGVVKNSKHDDLRDSIRPFVYEPYAQAKDLRNGAFYIRTSQDPSSLAGTVQQLVHRYDSNLPVYGIKTLAEQADESVYSDRLLTFFSLSLGLLAALLAAIGLYGVLAYMVARRTREIGIRMAIGAEPKDVSWLVLREVMRMSGIGLAIGLAIAFGLGLLIQSQLYGVRASDPLVFVAATLLLSGVAFLAGWLPARRAANVDPMAALRYE